MAKKFYLIVFFASFILFPAGVSAADFIPGKDKSANSWTMQDTLWEAAYLMTHVADWGQTRDISAQCGSGGYYEVNPVIGRCPSMSRVNLYFLSTALLHAGTATLLPKKYRRFFQTSTMVMEIGYITNNYNIGLKVNF